MRIAKHLYPSGICVGKGIKDEVFVSLVASFKFICKNKELKRQHLHMWSVQCAVH